MGNHHIECPYCGVDFRGLSGPSGSWCKSQEEAVECYRYREQVGETYATDGTVGELEVKPEPDRCPTCKQPIKQPMPPQRICCKCLKPITRHHKYMFIMTEHGYTALGHRNCDDPDLYKAFCKSVGQEP